MTKCSCEFDDDNADEVLSWCAFHAGMRDRIAELKAAIETHKSETLSAPTADPRDYMEVCEELWSVLHEG